MIDDRGTPVRASRTGLSLPGSAGPAPFRVDRPGGIVLPTPRCSRLAREVSQMHPIRRMMGAGVVAGLLLAGAQPASAESPEVHTWSNDVDVPYFDCGSFEAHGVWTVTHVLTVYLDKDGT